MFDLYSRYLTIDIILSWRRPGLTQQTLTGVEMAWRPFVRASGISSRVSQRRVTAPFQFVTKVITFFSDCSKLFFLIIKFPGSGLLELIKSAINNLGTKDVRNIGEKADTGSLMDQVQSFHTAALEFDLNENGSRRQFVLRSITRNHQKVSQLLNKPWNVDIASAGAVNDETEVMEPNLIFKLASPLKERTSYSCSDCGKTFSNWKMYKGHVKKKHDKVVEGQGPKVTCLLPHNRGTRVVDKHPMDQIASHIASVHNISKPTKDHKFRGFQSNNNGVTWEPVFLLDSQPDPTTTPSVETNAIPGGVSKSGAMKTAKKAVPATEVVHVEDKNDDQQIALVDEPTNKAEVQCGGQISPIQVPEETSDFDENLDQQTEKKEELEDEVESLVETETEQNHPNPEPEKLLESALWEVDDEICSSFEDRLKDSEAVNDGILDVEDLDSDVEDEDSADYTNQRIKTKRDRYHERTHLSPGHPANEDENKLFIENFVQFVVLHSTTMNEKSSTISLSTALLFRHPDSFLVFTRKTNPSFSLQNLLCFKDEAKLVELKDPSSWIDDIAGQDGRQNCIRRKEMYKAFKRLIFFVLKQLGKTDFATDVMSLFRRDKIKSNLKEVGEEINASKTWSKLQTLIDQEHKETEKAKQQVNPDEVFNAANGNQTYFNSPEFKKRLAKNLKIWENGLATGTFGPQNFDTLGQFARHLLCMTDRNRAAGYWFKNSHFDARKEIWFPPGHNKDKFDGIPENFNMFSQPEDGRQPDAWMIDVSGCDEILKMGQDVNIVVLKMAHDWLLKYRDAKQIKWSNIKLDEPFFVNNRRKKFGAMNNTAMLKEYATVTGTTKATTNTFRRAMEPAIQSNQDLKTRSKDIASHSETTGAKYYDASAPQFRAAAVHYLNDGEFEYEYASQSFVPEEVAAKRIKLDQEGQKSSLEKARKKISKDKSKRNVTLGSNCKVLPAHRVFMQESFSKDGPFSGFGFFKGKFPGDYLLNLHIFRHFAALGKPSLKEEKNP